VERDQDAPVPLLWQAKLLSLSRSRLYYEARPAREQEVLVKHRLDEWYTRRRYREEMGLSTLFPKPNLSRPSRQDHRTYPYLLRGLSIERPDQVWGVNIIYIRLRSGFLYLVAFLYWFSRLVVAWELSETLEMPFVLSCADAAFGRAVPDIIK